MLRIPLASPALRIILAALLLAASTATTIAAGAGAGADEADPGIDPGAYQRVNESLVRHHVVPRYRRFSASTARLREAAGTLCESPAQETLEGARHAYHAAMDDWMAMQHFPFGPLEQKLRAQRVYFWPQARGKIGEAIADLLAGGDDDVLSPGRFGAASAAVQGLPSAEYLLFVRGDVLSVDGEAGRAECRVLAAVSRNLEEIARDAFEEWTRAALVGGPSSYMDLMLSLGLANADFPAPRDATLLLFSALHDGLSLLVEVKLWPVIGDSPATVRPVLAESRASGRSTRNIAINLAALQALYVGEAGAAGLGDLVAASPQDTPLDPLMRKAFRFTVQNARTLDAALEEAAADPSMRQRVEKLSLQARALRQLVRTRVAEALHLAVGFNALDGD